MSPCMMGMRVGQNKRGSHGGVSRQVSVRYLISFDNNVRLRFDAWCWVLARESKVLSRCRLRRRSDSMVMWCPYDERRLEAVSLELVLFCEHF